MSEEIERQLAAAEVLKDVLDDLKYEVERAPLGVFRKLVNISIDVVEASVDRRILSLKRERDYKNAPF